MSPTGNILVGGGTGFIGKSLCSLLKQKGYSNTVISRMPGIQRVSWNDLQQLGLPKNTRAVVNLAGQNVMDISRRWTTGFKQNIIHSRVNTTKSLANLIEKTEEKEKPSVFIVISGVGAYKPDSSYEYTEDSCVKPYDFFSELCKDWEEAAQFQNSETKAKCRLVIIRSGVVLGRDGGMIKQLYLPFCLGLGGPVGDGSQFLPWIHMDDLINLIVFAIENPLVEGVLNGVAEKPCTNLEFTKAFAKALRRPAVLPVPAFVFNALLDKERAVMLTEGQKVFPKKTLSLGFCYKYPDIEAACNAIVKN